ncbi:STAS domain-containing protein [Kitasatospora sp. NPDC101155]|uniref:STAS domain-containing protein n=1 Tax=Kitasatospora sp. NPDC101155 TaxID=3364097 RepID=UPI003817057C
MADEGMVRIVTVAGELDHDTADGLRTALGWPVEEGTERIVVDLAELWFCESTGLNLLLHARLDAQTAGIRLELAGLRPIVAQLFAITGGRQRAGEFPRTRIGTEAAGPGAGLAASLQPPVVVLRPSRN